MKIVKILLLLFCLSFLKLNAQDNDVFERVYKMDLYEEDKVIIDSIYSLYKVEKWIRLNWNI
jgi:hypothetical protein